MMIENFKNNYLLRNKKAILYYVSKIFLGQLFGLIVFLIIWFVSPNKVININLLIYSTLGIFIFTVLYFYMIHKKDLLKTSYYHWPVDTMADYAAYLNDLYNETNKMQIRSKNIIRTTEKQLVTLIALRRRAMTLRNTEIVQEININYKEVLENRAEAKDIVNKISTHQNDISKLLMIYESGAPTGITLKNLAIYQNEHKVDKSSLFFIQKKNLKISNFIDLSANTYNNQS